jgi:hypothetical protein
VQQEVRIAAAILILWQQLTLADSIKPAEHSCVCAENVFLTKSSQMFSFLFVKFSSQVMPTYKLLSSSSSLVTGFLSSLVLLPLSQW